MKDALHFIFGLFGNITALALFLAPMITFYKVKKRGSTEEFSGIPYALTTLNCLLYTWYGLPFITAHNILIVTVNGAGAALEFFYVCAFLIYAPPNPRIQLMKILSGILGLFTIVAVISLFGLHHHNTRKLFVGSSATVVSVCMFASPFSSMRVVIRTKSVKYMPFFLSLCVFLCGTSWSVYGILAKDPFVAVPNTIGACLGLAQLVLYFIYRESGAPKSGGAEKITSEKFVETCGDKTLYIEANANMPNETC
ncbi:hypothetical protein SUGI_0012010 [Cryptomeria japonica]|uniref:bidirectional sugar transporter SWEET1 n=1 Tax=Cryptomeria japonica TaxID=3369 RepID=UPI002408C4B4|nr:bidirectional sugar transporter SWEET1 [Cryptomeria japonica]GLJ05146.1 hypothetical protein SUGI_0012010 [Cryptomeria japonica]